MELIEFIERFGALAILAAGLWLFGKFGLKRVDRHLDLTQKLIEQNGKVIEQNKKLVDTFSLSMASFNEFRKEERRTHEEILTRLSRIDGGSATT